LKRVMTHCVFSIASNARTDQYRER
jgi:hypothetical protein